MTQQWLLSLCGVEGKVFLNHVYLAAWGGGGGGGGKELLVAGEAACTHTRTRGGERGMGERETHTGRERETHRGGERENETERESERERCLPLFLFQHHIKFLNSEVRGTQK